MMPPSTTPAAGEARRHLEDHGYGLVLFAAVLLFVVGCFNMIQGIAAVANIHVFHAHAHYVFANLRAWGWITLIVGILQLLAAGGVLTGNPLARWFAVVVVGLNALDQMLSVPAYPFWSLTIIAMDVVALYGLCAYGTYDLTNHATLRDWPAAVTMIDLVWGTTLTATVATLGYVLGGMGRRGG